MTKKTILLIILTFTLTFIFHFGYSLLPNNISAIFFPVNESIWEHMKLLYTSFLVAQIIYSIISKEKRNLIVLVILSLLSIPLYLAIYLPVYYILGDNLIFSIALILVVAIIIFGYIRPIITKYFSNKPNLNILSILLIIASYLILGYLTFNPPHFNIFYDTKNYHYGIK